MKEKKNDLWKLDLLEAKFTQAPARFALTKKLLSARNNSQVLRKLPSTPNQAFQQINALKADLFTKKYHGSYQKLKREIHRKVKEDQRKWTSDHEPLQKMLASDEFEHSLIASKLAKIVSGSVLNTPESRLHPPAYIPDDVRAAALDKNNVNHPSHFFKTYCQNDKLINGYVSKLWNCAAIKRVLQESDWSFRKIRGHLTKEETASRAKEPKRSEVESGSDSEPDQVDAEHAFDKFDAYDDMVGDSDEEEFEADPNVDYNAITDESDFESDTESQGQSTSQSTTEKAKTEKEKKKSKIVLPSLATGYFSGGSDDEDVDNDKVVKEATSVRKNRRGQRARQKIWEQKYGSKAAHVQKEHQRITSEREQKQREFEERQRKREQKAKMAEEGGRYKDANAKPTAVHPSWEAKKRAEEKVKNAKFQGKKITFD